MHGVAFDGSDDAAPKWGVEVLNVREGQDARELAASKPPERGVLRGTFECGGQTKHGGPDADS